MDQRWVRVDIQQQRQGSTICSMRVEVELVAELRCILSRGWMESGSSGEGLRLLLHSKITIEISVRLRLLERSMEALPVPAWRPKSLPRINVSRWRLLEHKEVDSGASPDTSCAEARLSERVNLKVRRRVIPFVDNRTFELGLRHAVVTT